MKKPPYRVRNPSRGKGPPVSSWAEQKTATARLREATKPRPTEPAPTVAPPPVRPIPVPAVDAPAPAPAEDLKPTGAPRGPANVLEF